MTALFQTSAVYAVQRNLASATENVQRSVGRLASGLRINSASDDAAGLSLSAAFKSGRALHAQAYRNVNEAISMASIMDDALRQQSMLLSRMTELATQSANGITSSSQRTAMQSEFSALKSEYQRIAQSAEYNSRDLFSYSSATVLDNTEVMAGTTAGADSTIEVEHPNLNFDGNYATFTMDLDLIQDMTDAYDDVIGHINSHGNGTFSYSLAEIEAHFSTANFQSTVVAGTNGGSARDVLLVALGKHQSTDGDWKVFFLTWEEDLVTPGNWSRAINVMTAISVATAENDVSSEASAYEMVVSSNDLGVLDENLSGLETDSSSSTVINTIDTSDFENAYSAPLLDDLSVDTQNNALAALDGLETIQENLSAVQGRVGMVLSRMSYAVSLLSKTADEFELARSRVEDLDVAQELSILVRNQIQQSTASALFAHAVKGGENLMVLFESPDG